jgi:hypothetical protein
VSQLVRKNADLEGTMASGYENRVSFASILPRKIIEGNESKQLPKHEAYWKSGHMLDKGVEADMARHEY